MTSVQPSIPFDTALAEVDDAVAEFRTKEGAERTSQREKNAALYAALERAYRFHVQWHGTKKYEAHLNGKGVKLKAKAGASAFTPTIKAFFHDDLDKLKPAKHDEAGRKEKARKQKAVSSYCAALEWAVISQKADAIATFLGTQGEGDRSGVDAAGAALAEHRRNSETAKQREARLEAAKELRTKSLLGVRLEGKQDAMPLAAGYAGNVMLAAFEIGADGKPMFLEYVQEPFATDFYRRYLLDVPTDTDLDKLLKLLSFAAPVQGHYHMVKVVNTDAGFELLASSPDARTAIGYVKLPQQSYLPNGTYWFGDEIIASLKKLAVLARYGALYEFHPQGTQVGKSIPLPISIARTTEAIAAYNMHHAPNAWDWDGALAKASGTFTHEDGKTLVEITTFVDKVGSLSEAMENPPVALLTPPMIEWLARHLSQPSDAIADERLKQAIYGGADNNAAKLRLSGNTIALVDDEGDVERLELNAPIGLLDATWEFGVAPSLLISATEAVQSLAPGGKLLFIGGNGVLRVRGNVADCEVEYEIPVTSPSI